MGEPATATGPIEAPRPGPSPRAALGPVLPCALAGLLVGAGDVLDTMLTGWTARLDLAQSAAFLAVGLVVGFALGAAIGLVWAGVAGAGARLGLVWWPDGLRLGSRMVLPAARVQAVLTAFITAWTVAALCLFRSIVTGPHGRAVAAAAVAGVALTVVSARLRARALAGLLWLVLLAWVAGLETRLLYAFSRYGAAMYVHAVSACLLVLLVRIVAARAFPGALQRLARHRGAAVVAAAASLAVLGGLRFPLDGTSSQLRLALYERTTILYRAFLHMPHRSWSAATIRQAAQCPPAPPAAAPASAAAQPKRPRGVVLIVLDAARGDHAPWSHRPGMTPALARLASQGTVFTRAYTSVPGTKFAALSMMTGAAALVADAPPPASAYLGPRLRAAGIRTICLADHKNLKLSMGDFDVFEPLSANLGLAARRTTGSRQSYERARFHLDALAPDQRFLMVVHFYDPHNDYVPNELFDFGSSLHERYDAELAYADHFIGRLLEHLQARDLVDDVAVLVAGDHGDEFWEHRYRWHRVRVYDESVRVAMLLRTPGGQRGATVATPVSIVDVAPTVLDLFGLDPSATLGGTSLVPAAHGVPLPRDRIVVTASPQYPTFGVVSEGQKLVVHLGGNLVERYDLDRDPGEHDNLGDQAGPVTTRLSCALADWLETHR